MNININDIKNGMTVKINGNLYQIIEFQHVKPGKGPAFVRIKLKNLKTGSTTEETFNTNIKVEKAHVEKMSMQYLYNTGDTYIFMNTQNFEQLEIPATKLEDEIKYLKENLNIEIVTFEGEIIGINLPEKLEFRVIETTDAVKGNTATNTTKDAVIETGHIVKVPLFINTNDNIIINTKDGKYDSRA